MMIVFQTVMLLYVNISNSYSICNDVCAILTLMFVIMFEQYGNTPLHAACQRGHVKVVKVLLANVNVDVNAVNEVSAPLSHVNAYDIMRQLPILVCLCTQCGNTALHVACKYGNTKVVEILLRDPRVDVNKANAVSLLMSNISMQYGTYHT